MNAAALTAGAGAWLQRHGTLIRRVQWLVVAFYAVLVVVPALLPLPDETSHVFNHLTVFAQFVFWGLWWPFVLVSMVLVGRMWCGILCPEGALSEWASRHGRHRAIPRWMTWGGWPFVAFAGTTIYGQMVSVYQYPKAVLLVLGGSTLAAMVVGFLYGREKRVWCKYLCPVNGVFALLAKLAPLHMRVAPQAWRASYANPIRIQPVNCAPLVPLRSMVGASDCHMCGRCSGHRGAIDLTPRTSSQEVVDLGATQATGWQALLILFGLLGLAIGAFQWTVNPHVVLVKQRIAEWLIERDVLWPLADNAPWWLLTHYPEQRDVFNWLDGAMVVGYIVGTGLLMGGVLSLLLATGIRILGPWQRQRFFHLSQALIPLAGCGVFLGLSALTVSLLKAEGMQLGWVTDVRLLLLAGATLWSLRLAVGVVSHYPSPWTRRTIALALFLCALATVDCAWTLMFWVW